MDKIYNFKYSILKYYKYLKPATVYSDTKLTCQITN